MTATEQALMGAVASAHSGNCDEGRMIVQAIMNAIRANKIPGLIMWAQPMKES